MTMELVDETTLPRSVARVLDLFEIVLAGRCNLTAAANASDLTPTTALRYLRALEARGYVDRNGDGDYLAGPTILRIAAALRSATGLDRLAERTGESAYLAVSDGRTGTYVATAESARAIRHVGWVGQNVDLAGTALGAALGTPGVIANRTGAVEADVTAMSLALPAVGKLGVAVSIVGPSHRFSNEGRASGAGDDDGTDARPSFEQALTEAVGQLERELRINGEDLTS